MPKLIITENQLVTIANLQICSEIGQVGERFWEKIIIAPESVFSYITFSN